MWFKEEQVGQISQSLTCSITEKPHTGLDDCLNILLACFRKRMSGQQYVVRDYYVGEYEGDGMGGAASAATAAPWIDPETPTNVTVVAGRTAILACVVRELGTASVRKAALQASSL